MLAGIAGRGIPCVYVYRVAGDWGIGPGPYGSLRRADNGGYFSGLSVARGRGGRMFCLAREVGGGLDMFLLRKG